MTRFHVEFNVQTKLETTRPYTPEEEAEADELAAISARHVKTEAARRIELVLPMWMVSREVSGGTPIPQNIKDVAEHIRQRSNAIEAMSPIPQDYFDDSHWA